MLHHALAAASECKIDNNITREKVQRNSIELNQVSLKIERVFILKFLIFFICCDFWKEEEINEKTIATNLCIHLRLLLLLTLRWSVRCVHIRMKIPKENFCDFDEHTDYEKLYDNHKQDRIPYSLSILIWLHIVVCLEVLNY